MSKKQLKREEIDNNYKWDLTFIFKSDEEFLKQLELANKEVDKISSFKGKIISSSNDLLKFLKYSNDYERKLYKLYYYANLNHDSDTTNVIYQDYKGRVVNLITKYDELSSFINPEFMSVDYEVIIGFMEELEELKEYKFNFDNIYRFKEHILSEEIEKVISSLSKVCSSSSDTYNSLTDSDIKFGNITDEDGTLVELTESNYSNFLHSSDCKVRETAFKTILSTYGSYKNTITKTFLGQIESLVSLAKLKKYNSSIEASLFADNVDKKVYDNFIEVVNNNLDVLYKYYDMKKEFLGLDEFHLYDLYFDLIKEYDKEYEFNDAKTLVIEALAILGDDYVEILNKAFDEKWIDVYNNIGKRSGAYSSGFYDTKPYILLNYEGKIKDVSTLAHELGHSLHTYYSCLNQPYQYSNYKIFVAEVASTVNELLLNFHLLNKSKDKEEKKYILNSMMELFKGTIFRQIMFAEFERDCHKKHEDGTVLTYELLCNDYYDLNKKYFGDNVVIDDEIRYEWERIPHFYYNFYVYKYAIGLSCACYIVDGILNDKDNMKDNYKKFLSAGASDYPVNILRNAGIDVTSKDFIESAIKMFDDIIEQFKELI